MQYHVRTNLCSFHYNYQYSRFLFHVSRAIYPLHIRSIMKLYRPEMTDRHTYRTAELESSRCLRTFVQRVCAQLADQWPPPTRTLKCAHCLFASSSRAFLDVTIGRTLVDPRHVHINSSRCVCVRILCGRVSECRLWVNRAARARAFIRHMCMWCCYMCGACVECRVYVLYMHTLASDCLCVFVCVVICALRCA